MQIKLQCIDGSFRLILENGLIKIDYKQQLFLVRQYCNQTLSNNVDTKWISMFLYNSRVLKLELSIVLVCWYFSVMVTVSQVVML